MNYDAIIVGGGLFGSVIGRALVDQGRSILIIDRDEPEAGSGPAACLMKPSWFAGMGKDVHVPSLNLLSDLYGVQDLEFQLRPSKGGPKVGWATVHWINPASILQWGGEHRTLGDVRAIGGGGVLYNSIHGVEQADAPLIVVAAGVWTERLLGQYQQTAQKGVAFLFQDQTIDTQFIQPWAPFKQLVAFNRGDGLWVGDGTAIKADNWTNEREMKTYLRCRDAVGAPAKRSDKAKVLTGLRPYAKGHKPCLIEQVQPGLWVASGGAKNGTVAAGYCAHLIRERTT